MAALTPGALVAHEIQWKVKLDQGKYWLFMRCAGPHWVPIDSFTKEGEAWARANIPPGEVEVSGRIAVELKVKPKNPEPASVFEGLDIGAFINAEIKEMNNG